MRERVFTDCAHERQGRSFEVVRIGGDPGAPRELGGPCEAGFAKSGRDARRNRDAHHGRAARAPNRSGPLPASRSAMLDLSTLLTPWAALQVAALLCAAALFTATAGPARRRLLPLLLPGFVGALLGAVGLGTVLRVPAWIAAGFRGSPVSSEVLAYGGLVGLAGGYVLAARARRVPVAAALDALAAPAGVVVLVARLGCFAAGCCFGAVSEVPWAVRFANDSPAFHRHVEASLARAGDAASLPVHPTQLYEAGLGLIVALVALGVRRQGLRPGSAFAAAAALYAVGRAVIDLARADPGRGFGPFTMAQCLGLSVIGCVAWWWLDGGVAAEKKTGTLTAPDSLGRG
jgi:phosphatidylglycerol---prolipoprotein diacylglyceryl transferase